jgi:single-strand DNA-binding protein
LATNRTYVTEGERKEEVDFHKLVAWNKLAELCNQLLKKGNRVFVSGRLQTRSWEGQDGQQRQTTEIVIEDMILLTPKTGGEWAGATEGSGGTSGAKESEEPKVAEERVKEPEESEVKETEKTEPEATEEKPPKEDVSDDLPF